MGKECGRCSESLPDEPRLKCTNQSCKLEFHYKCVNKKPSNPPLNYVCARCLKKEMERREAERCAVCKLDIADESQLVVCCDCRLRFHTTCVGLDTPFDKQSDFKCSQCQSMTPGKKSNKTARDGDALRKSLFTSKVSSTGAITKPTASSDDVEVVETTPTIDNSELIAGLIAENETLKRQSELDGKQMENFSSTIHDFTNEMTRMRSEFQAELDRIRSEFAELKTERDALAQANQQLIAVRETQSHDNEFPQQTEARNQTREHYQQVLENARLALTQHTIINKVENDSSRLAMSHSVVETSATATNVQHGQDQVGGFSTIPPTTSQLTTNRDEDDRQSITSNHSTQSQLDCEMKIYMLRQMVDKLPSFDGLDLQAWTEFEEAFNTSTRVGRYDEYENLFRLKKCLKPPARDLVQSLLRGNKASTVIDTLRSAYGRPDHQLAAMMEEILKLPKITSCRDSNIRIWALTLKGYVDKVKSLKKEECLRDLGIVSMLLHKTEDCPLYEKWRNIQAINPSAAVEEFTAFISRHWEALPPALRDGTSQVKVTGGHKSNHKQNSRRPSTHYSVNQHQVVSSTRQQSNSSSNSTNTNKKCVNCDEAHWIYQCGSFKQKSISEREKIAKEKNLCFSCLRLGHRAQECPIARVCGIKGCTRKHNRLLHSDSTATTTAQPNAATQQAHASSDESTVITHAPHINTHSTGGVLAKVVPVRIYGRNGRCADTFAYLDDGSHVTMIDRELVKTLKLSGELEDVNLQWTKEITRKETALRCSIELNGHGRAKRYRFDNVYAVDDMLLPVQNQDGKALSERYKHLRNLNLPSFNDGKPRVLIGLDQAKFLTGETTVEGTGDHEPIATKTRLGWVVYGATEVGGSKASLSAIHIPVLTNASVRSSTTETLHRVSRSDDELHELFKQHTTTESFGVSPSAKNVKSREDERAEEIMRSTLKFVNGRYEVGLLWKSDDIKLPDSYPMALKRLQKQEQSLIKKPEVMKWMCDHIRELIDKGYARYATEEDLNTKWPRVWYLPTFVTYNMNKDPPKPRCVWDVAAKHNYGPDGISLNSCLLSGPDNIASLLAGLIRIREYAIPVNGDVKEMFHQVKINLVDQQCQRFLWRDCDQSKEPRILIMESMAFGPTDSPSKSQFVKNFHAEKYRQEYPEACEALQNWTYVDDYFNSHETTEEAIRVTNDAIRICSDMNFDLVGIQSTSSEVLNAIPHRNVKPDLVNLEGRDNSPNYVTKILGMHWDTTEDVFLYRKKVDELMKKMVNENYHPTKREALRVVMRIFDPLGLAAKFTIRGKMILQDIWRAGIDWDEQITSDIFEDWRKFLNTFDEIEKIRIPRRYVKLDPRLARVELITFVDASDKAFAAISYFRFTTEDHNHIALVAAKAKVAPVNPLTIPRLELQAAILGVRLATTMKSLHSFKIDEQLFLSDSTCVLSWICNPKSKHDKFIGARIGEILEKSSSPEWYHVRTKENVADEATKVTTDNQDIQDSRWFSGPEFLKLPREEWPIERQPTKFVAVHATTQHLHPLDMISLRFQSKWMSLVHITAFMLRTKMKKSELPHNTVIGEQEIRNAELVIFRKIQQDCFTEELETLQNWGKLPNEEKRMMNCVPASSSIRQYNPFLDDNGLIRMSSLNQCSTSSYAARNPVILPSKHKFVNLLVTYHHQLNHHVGTETIVADLREKAWIISVRETVKRIANKCMICRIRKAKPERPISAALHAARTAFHLPAFSHVGVDCFGPIEVIQGRTRVVRNVALFTCLTSRAIHMEILHDMTADKMLGAIRRMIGRRGRLLSLYSDNGTNFTGAHSQMKKDYDEVQAKYGKMAADQLRVDWKFIPAYSPWMGGAWERLIHQVKRVLEDILRPDAVHDDVLANALIEAELIMNNRPLTHTPTNPEDEFPLTPNMKLFGEKIPPEYYCATEPNDRYDRRSHFKSQELADRIAARWTREYLPEISRRSEKSLGRVNADRFQVGDVVLVTEPNLPRAKWRLGRIVHIHPTRDGRPRSIDVKLTNGTIAEKRSVGRCALVDTRGEEESSSS